MIWWDLRKLTSSDYHARIQAVLALSGKLSPRAFCALAVVSCDDDDDQVRTAAQRSLDATVARLHLYSAGSVIQFLEWVVEKGDPRSYRHAIEPLMDALSRSVPFTDGHSRAVAARLLGRLADARAVPLLVGAFLDSEQAVIDALAQIGSVEAIDALAQLMEEHPHRNIDNRLRIMGPAAVRPSLVGQLGSENWFVRDNAKKLLDSMDPNWPKNALARQALPELVEACWSEVSEREPALQEARYDDALQAVDRMDPDYWRSFDANRLAPGLIEILLKEFLDGRNVDQARKRTSARLLLRMGDTAVTSAVDVLLETLGDPGYGTQRAASAFWILADAMRKFDSGGPGTSTRLLLRATVPLIRALNDDYSWARTSAAHALGGLRDRTAIGPLVLRLQQDEDNFVLSAALDALEDLGWVPATGPEFALRSKAQRAQVTEGLTVSQLQQHAQFLQRQSSDNTPSISQRESRAEEEFLAKYRDTLMATFYNLRGKDYDTHDVVDSILRGLGADVMQKYSLSEAEMVSIVSRVFKEF